MRTLFSAVLGLALLAGFTFGFVVLFEHGPANFAHGAKTEWSALLSFIGAVLSGREGARPPSAAQLSTAPASACVTASPSSRGTQTVEGANRPVRGSA